MIKLHRLPQLSVRLGFFLLLGISFYLSIAAPDEQSLIASLWDKFSHAAGYFALVLLLDLSFRPTAHLVPKSAAILVYSILMECIQFFIPYREFSLMDILANMTGIAVFLLLRLFEKYRISSNRA